MYISRNTNAKKRSKKYLIENASVPNTAHIFHKPFGSLKNPNRQVPLRIFKDINLRKIIAYNVKRAVQMQTKLSQTNLTN